MLKNINKFVVFLTKIGIIKNIKMKQENYGFIMNRNCPICITGKETYLVCLKDNIEIYYIYCTSCESHTTNYTISKINYFAINGLSRSKVIDINKIKES